MPETSKDRAGIEAIAELLTSSARDTSFRRIGIEIERIGIWEDCTPFDYADTRSAEGETRPGARTLLERLSDRYGWPLSHNVRGEPLGLKPENGQITLEPGSQVELSTEASDELASLVENTDRFERAVDQVTRDWGLTWIGLGVNPCNGAESIQVIPSDRYHIMTEYLGSRARLATSMMRISSSVQVNLDYHGEAEGIEMLRVSLAATPVSYALFANSPLHKGKETGVLSFRHRIWEETDPDRTGLLPLAFEKDFCFTRYAEYLWNYPLMFAKDPSGKFVPTGGKSLRQIAAGELPGVEPDAENRISAVRQLFTEARIKPGYVEVRSVDGQRPAERYAAAAFWMGILYDSKARAWVMEKLAPLPAALKEKITAEAARVGLAAECEGIRLRPLCEELISLARAGLERRGFGEEKYLVPLERNVSEGITPAEKVLKIFRETPTKKIRAVLDYCSCEKDRT